MHFKTYGQRRDISIQIWLFGANNEGVATMKELLSNKPEPLNKKLAQGDCSFVDCH